MAEESGRNNLDLQAAMALLIQTQAEFVKDMAQHRREFEELRRLMIYYGEVLAKLPEAIREKIGFTQ